jgi:hypothetical protein
MGSRLSAGFECHHCDTGAPTDKDGFFQYLTYPDRENAEAEPSCPGHADLIRVRAGYISARSGRLALVAA